MLHFYLDRLEFQATALAMRNRNSYRFVRGDFQVLWEHVPLDDEYVSHILAILGRFYLV